MFPGSGHPSSMKFSKKSKGILTSSQVLLHFNPNLDLILACDTSSYDIGVVLAHKISDGVERLIAFVPKILTDLEQRYTQTKQEALACVFGIKKFHPYLYGHHFTLITDSVVLISKFNFSFDFSILSKLLSYTFVIPKLLFLDFSFSFGVGIV